MNKIRADEGYAKLLLKEGSNIPSDVDTNFEMNLPDWADHKQIKRQVVKFDFVDLETLFQKLAVSCSLFLTSTQCSAESSSDCFKSYPKKRSSKFFNSPNNQRHHN